MDAVSALVFLIQGETVHAQDQLVDGHTVTVSGTPPSDYPSPWIVTGVLTVGGAGTGALTVSNGGSVNADAFTIAQQSGSTGTLNIGSAAGSAPTAAGTVNAATIAFGAGTGTINFNHTGNPDGSDYSFAPVITGTGTINQIAGNTILTGSNGAGNNFTGTLNVTGGNLTINGTFGDTANNGATVNVTGNGNLTGSGTIAGNLVLDGSNLSWQSGQSINVTRFFKVGDTIEGSLSLSGGSSVTASSLQIGADTEGSGTVTLDGANTQMSATELLVGFKGDGALTISGGAKLNSRLTILGTVSGSKGTATVSGLGSTWTLSSNLRVGESGTGTLIVQNGSSVYSVGATITSDADASPSSATVTGAGSTWISSGGSTDIASRAGASLFVVNGGTFSSINASGIYVGGGAGRSGTVTVNGAGSSLTSSSDLHLGYYGTGKLTVADGGAVSVAGKILITDDSGATGTLNIGSAAGDAPTAAGTVNAATIAFGAGTGTINFNHTGNPDGSDYSFAPVITGTGTINQIAGNTILTGSNGAGNNFTGTLNVTGGNLTIAGTFGDTTNRNATVNVTGAGNLTGSGTIAGSVQISNGGSLSGQSGQTLIVGGNLLLTSGATFNAVLDGLSAPALVQVGGNLTLGGTLNVADAGNFGRGVYRLFDYAGALTNNGLSIGTIPAGIDASDLAIQTSAAGKVNLVSAAGASLSFWDGGSAGLHDNSVVDGGSGVWTAELAPVSGNWTDQTGATNVSYDRNPSFAIFQGIVGTVTIDDNNGSVGITGMQFAVDGYRIDGDPLLLQGGTSTTMRVGDGTSAGAGYEATIASLLTGSSGLTKTDLGTLVLTGENTYSGTTTISAGTLQVGAGGTAGSIAGDVITNGKLAFNHSDNITFSGKINGAGQVIQRGTGTLELTNSQNRYTGGTVIESGTLAGSTVSIRGDIVNNGVLRITDMGDNTYYDVISGTGSVFVDGIGTLTLAGTSSFTGGLIVVNGKNINVSADANLGGTSNVITLNGASLTATASFTTQTTVTLSPGGGYINAGAGATLSLGGTINGTGNLIKAGAGTLNILGTTVYTGATSINQGTLAVAAGASIASSSQLTVGQDGTLTGSGTVGSTIVSAGGHISPGSSIGSLTVVGDLTLSSGAVLDYQLGSAGSQGNPASGKSDRIDVSGNLSLDGTLNLQQSGSAADGTPGFGYYRLITYGGNLSGPGLTVGTELSFGEPTAYQIQAGSGHVDLFVAAAGNDSLQTWAGGNGSWTTSAPVWLNQNGTLPVAWADNTAVFKDDPSGPSTGATIDIVGTQSFKGLQFVDEAYRLQGTGTLLINGSGRADNTAEIRVLADQAEIAATIAGSGGITKTEAGTLVLSGVNSYSGGTKILGGAIEVASDGNLGASTGGLALNGGTLATLASFTSTRNVSFGIGNGAFDVAAATNLALSGTITGSGRLIKQGSGVLTLSGTNSYGGTLFPPAL